MITANFEEHARSLSDEAQSTGSRLHTATEIRDSIEIGYTCVGDNAGDTSHGIGSTMERHLRLECRSPAEIFAERSENSIYPRICLLKKHAAQDRRQKMI